MKGRDPWEERYDELLGRILDVTEDRRRPLGRDAAMRFVFKLAWMDGWHAGIQRAELLNRGGDPLREQPALAASAPPDAPAEPPDA